MTESTTTPMTADEIEDLAQRFLAAILNGDVDAVLAIYADDATIWHNFDNVDQTPAENARTMKFLIRTLTNMRYEEIRRNVLPDGYVQQHVLRATGPKGELNMPAMLRAYTAGGRVTRLEEYLDPAAFAAAVG